VIIRYQIKMNVYSDVPPLSDSDEIWSSELHYSCLSPFPPSSLQMCIVSHFCCTLYVGPEDFLSHLDCVLVILKMEAAGFPDT